MVKWIDCGKGTDTDSVASGIQGIQMLLHIGHLLHFKCETRNLFFAGINETGKTIGDIFQCRHFDKALDLGNAHM